MNPYKISSKRHHNYSNNNDNKKIKYLKGLITRVLLSIILVISISIFLKLDSQNEVYINKYLFEDNLKFTQINKWYQDKFGSLIPKAEDTSLMVSGESLKNNPYEKIDNGVKIKVTQGSPISLINGGIVVFIGDKDEGHTIIIQGNDGIDYWYGGITSTSVNLYDYLEKDTLIGEAQDNFIYLVLQKVNIFVIFL